MKGGAKNRDHKKLGRELDLFIFAERVGSGLTLFTPRGTLLRDLLDNFVWELRARHGYERVDIPHLAKKELYLASGHWEKFADEIFTLTSREKHLFALKPMNCPHHVEIYNRRPWSWRELPVRYASTTKVYRDEQSGELNGLVRTRAITQDDAHVFCRRAQVRAEIEKIWQIVNEFYTAFGLKPTEVRISLHDPKQPEKYLGDEKLWRAAENDLRQIASEADSQTIEAVGEAAFYGPKVDFMIKDSLGREWQVATIQLDLNMPERFNLTCLNEAGSKERIVMIHAAIMGSLERFLAVLLEHTGGNLPLWLAPVQIAVLPIGASHQAYGQKILAQLKNAGLRAELNDDRETLAKKIRRWQLAKIPYAAVIGDDELKTRTLTVEGRGGSELNKVTVRKFIEQLKKEILDKK